MENSPSITDWIQTAFTAILALLTFFYVRTTGQQLAKMTEALEETRKSNEHTAENNRIARESMEAERRAWIVPAKVEGKIPNRLDVTIKNSGGMPATEITITAESSLIATESRERLELIEAFVGSLRETLGNGETHTFVVLLGIRPENEDTIRRIVAKENTLQVMVRIYYNDGFSTRATLIPSVWSVDEWFSGRDKLI